MALYAVNIAAGGTITQDFSIGTSANAYLPTDWKADNDKGVRTVGSYDSAGTKTTQAGGNSMATGAQNGIYNFGAGDAATATDRAVGGISSKDASKSVNIYVKLTNNGSSAISDFTISYNVEKYRMGSNPAGFSIQMYYSTDGSTWNSAGSNFLTSFPADPGSTQNDNSGYASAPGETEYVINQTLDVSLASGSSLYLAWNYSVTSGTTTSSAQALGIDDVTIVANQEDQPPLPVVLTSFMAAISNQNYINLTWITQTETGMMGYYIMRNNVNDLATAQIVSPLIPAINSSQPKAYIYTDQEVTQSGTYYYWLQANDMDGTIYILSFVSIEYNSAPGGTTPSIPLVTELNNVYPNPFNPQLFIPFSLANKSEVKIIIYNTRGQVVKDFALGEKNAGNYRIEWDGTDNNGKAVPNGIYCIRMIAGKDYYQTKAILMK
jgi:hypothetical protein